MRDKGAEPAVSESLRDENRRRARERIVAATAEWVRESGHTNFTMPDIAERSGVALRTLYRHFPKRQDLVDALASVADQVTALGLPTSLDELEPWLVRAWANLLAEEALIRAQHLGPAGAEVRRARVPSARRATRQLLGELYPDLDEDDLDETVDVALLLTSSTALFEFTDVLGISSERGARLAARAVRDLLEARCGKAR